MSHKESTNSVVQLSIARRRPFLSGADESVWLTGPKQQSRPQVGQSLLIHTLFGHLLLISDSNLLHDEEAMRLLLDEDSLLRVMLDTKYVKLVTLSRSEKGFVSAASRTRGLEGKKDIIEVWEHLASIYWRRGDVVRMPCNRLAVGFYNEQMGKLLDDPRAIEFKKYPTHEFEEMTEPQPKSRSKKLSERDFRRKAISDQYCEYGRTRSESIFAEDTDPPTGIADVQTESLAEIDLLSVETQDNSIWQHPVVAVDPCFLNMNQHLLKPLVDLSSSRRRRVRSHCRSVYSLCYNSDVKTSSTLLNRLDKLTQEYIAELGAEENIPGLSSVLGLPSSKPEDWIRLNLRQIMPGIVSAASGDYRAIAIGTEYSLCSL